MEAPSGCTIAQKGSQGQHSPQAAATTKWDDREAPSRGANCALSPDSPPASGCSNRNRNSVRPPPLSAGRGSKDRTRLHARKQAAGEGRGLPLQHASGEGRFR
ncbi:PREDICTED: uncharacterized protein LOC105593505 [Cercocebus atys]|uniref:uncharacterized protein LOC105593505 n=1 Tax=Cercocebus atys TaxID=9531 RepID=UPI0005F54E62|nr:PREDICTED: uncharacterized protein LOC105593505 [Cercocebus atys]